MGEWFRTLWQKISSAFTEFLSASGINFLIAALVLVIGVILIKLIFNSIVKKQRANKNPSAVVTFLISIGRFFSYLILLLIILSILGVPIDSLIVILGSVSIAVGLAMQGTLSNFFSGLMLLITKPFKIGDYVDVGDKSGSVVSIGILNTTLTSPDNKMIVISNGEITQHPIVNYNFFKTRRMEIKFYTSVKADAQKVKEIVLNVLINHQNVIKAPLQECINAEKPEEKTKGAKRKKLDLKALQSQLNDEFDPNSYELPAVRLLEFAPAHLTFSARVWVETKLYWDTFFQLTEQIQTALIENKIETAVNIVSIK